MEQSKTARDIVYEDNSRGIGRGHDFLRRERGLGASAHCPNNQETEQHQQRAHHLLGGKSSRVSKEPRQEKADPVKNSEGADERNM